MRRYTKIGVGFILVSVLSGDVYAFLYRNKPGFRNSWFVYELNYSLAYLNRRVLSKITWVSVGYGYFNMDHSTYHDVHFKSADQVPVHKPVEEPATTNSHFFIPFPPRLTIPSIEPIHVSTLTEKPIVAVLTKKRAKKVIDPLPNHLKTVISENKTIKKTDNNNDHKIVTPDSNKSLFVKVTGLPIGYNQINSKLKSYEKVDSNHNASVYSLQQLIINKTHTPTGEKLFTAFNDMWQSPSKDVTYVITITEKPLPSMNTMIVITVDNTIAFQTQLNPNSKYIDNICRIAIHYVILKLNSQRIINY